MPAEESPQIRVLDDLVCNQIAAGEVIERPASVFKELVENAVDAGATEIRVEVLQGGRKAVIVTDNGCGMDQDSCLLSVERHATSKIRDAEDIEKIHSMGFRGEALAAITSVSRFILESRPGSQLEGTRVQIDGGKLTDVTETGCPPGTRIEVRNLFFNTPARKKFLRTEATELSYIRTLFQTFALAHPDVALRLDVDGRTLEQLPAQAHLADRIADIFGQELFSRLHPVDVSRGEIRIHGFIGLPTLHRSDRRDQVTLINRRPATAPLLGYAIREAYANSLPSGRHPVLFLHLELPAEWVDVNVHPTKREVRFGPSQLIRDFLMDAIQGVLSPAALPRNVPREFPRPAEPPQLSPEKRHQNLPTLPLGYPPLPPRIPPGMPAPEQVEESIPSTTRPASPPDPPEGPRLWMDAVYLGSEGEFHVLTIGTGFVILYPKAALERVLYEQALREWKSGSVSHQGLLLPETVSCSPGEARCIREQLELLQELGFSVAEFGDDTFLVEAIPGWMQDVPVGEALHAFAEKLATETRRNAPDSVREHLARSCCRLAAHRKPTGSPEAILALLHTLGTCEMPYTTPSGKPTLLHLGTEDFRRKFGLS